MSTTGLDRADAAIVARPFRLGVLRAFVTVALLIPLAYVATRPVPHEVRLAVSAIIVLLLVMGWMVIGRAPHEWSLGDERADMRDFAGVREIAWGSVVVVELKRLPEAGRCLVIVYDEPAGGRRKFYLPLWLVRRGALAVLLGKLSERVPQDRFSSEAATLARDAGRAASGRA